MKFKRLIIGLLLPALLLSGCGAEETFETVADDLVMPAMAPAKTIVVQLPGETARFCISKGDITARGKFFKCGFLGPAPALLNQSYERVSGSQRSGLLLIDFTFLEQFLVHPQN